MKRALKVNSNVNCIKVVFSDKYFYPQDLSLHSVTKAHQLNFKDSLCDLKTEKVLYMLYLIYYIII